MLFPKFSNTIPWEFASRDLKNVRKSIQKIQERQTQLYLARTAETLIGSNRDDIKVPCALAAVWKNIGNIPKGTDEYERALQFLIMLSIKPKYLINLPTESQKKEDKINKKKLPQSGSKALGQFESKALETYKLLDTFMDSLRISLMYIERGTKDLDRDPIEAGPETETILAALKNELDICFKSYYLELKRDGLNIKHEPCVDEGLLRNCLQKKWLLPISNVLLIRAAQYQMMGIEDYKKYREELLAEEARPFIIDPSLPYDNGLKCAHTTYKYAQRIKCILLNWIRKNAGSYSVQETIVTHYRNKLDEQANNFKLTPEQYSVFMPSYEESLQDLNHFQPNILDIPIIDKTKLALNISETFDLGLDQFLKLRNDIPLILRKRGADFKLAKDGATSEEQKKYERVLTAFSDFIDPNNFLKAEKIEANRICKKLKDAASVIEGQIGKSGKQNIEKAYDIIYNYIEFKDLTLPCLFLSKAIDLQYIGHIYIEGFPNKLTKSLTKKMRKYQQEEQIRKMSGVTELNQDLLVCIMEDDEYQNQRKSIKQLKNEINWQDFFIAKYNQIIKDPHSNIVYFKMDNATKGCDEEVQSYFFYLLCLQMMNDYLRELKAEIITTVIVHYIEVARNDVKDFLKTAQ